jgi:hypothetical protein
MPESAAPQRVRPTAATTVKRTWSAALVAVFAALICFIAAWPTPARAQATLDNAIYKNGLRTGWENYSWGSAVDLAATPPGSTDQHAIALTVIQPYGALHLHCDGTVALTPYSALQFDLQATVADQVFTAVLYDENDQQIDKPKPLARYGGLPTPGTSKTYVIPLGPNGLNAQGRQIRSIVLQSDSGHAEPTVYFRQIGFISAAAPLPPSNAASASPAGGAAGTKAAVRKNRHEAANQFLIGLAIAVVAITLLTALLEIRPEPQPAETEDTFVPFSSERYRRPPAFR